MEYPKVTEYRVTNEPKREPTHPGELLAEALEHEGVSVMVAAEALGVTRQTLHRVIAKQSGITPEMAVRIGRFIGNGPGLWLRMQQAYDLWHAERALRKERTKIGAISTVGARRTLAAEKRLAAKRMRRRHSAKKTA